MNRSQSHRNIFIEDKERQTFLDLLGDMARLWKIEIYAYCLMDNHYHLLLSTPTGFCRDRCAISMGSIRRSSIGSIIVTDRCFVAGIKRSSLRRKSIFYRWSAIFIKIWGACATVIGELNLFIDEGASSEREAASARVLRIEDTLTKSKKRT